jgi:hypothetical protein
MLIIGYVVVSNTDVRRWIDDAIDRPQPAPTTQHEGGDVISPTPKQSSSTSRPPTSPGAGKRDEVRYPGQAWVVAAPGQNGSSDYPTRSVDCGRIDTFIKLGTVNGSAGNAWKWKLFVSNRADYQGSPISGVNVDPPTGTVEVGQTPTLRVTGSYEGRSGAVFYIHVESVYGSGGAALAYTCR